MIDMLFILGGAAFGLIWAYIKGRSQRDIGRFKGDAETWKRVSDAAASFVGGDAAGKLRKNGAIRPSSVRKH